MSDEFLPLANVVRSLRVEIAQATKAGANESVRFEVGPIDLEFQVVAKKEADGEIKFGVLGLGFEVGGKFSSDHVQKVKVTLKPLQVLPDGSLTELEILKVPSAT